MLSIERGYIRSFFKWKLFLALQPVELSNVGCFFHLPCSKGLVEICLVVVLFNHSSHGIKMRVDLARRLVSFKGFSNQSNLIVQGEYGEEISKQDLLSIDSLSFSLCENGGELHPRIFHLPFPIPPPTPTPTPTHLVAQSNQHHFQLFLGFLLSRQRRGSRRSWEVATSSSSSSSSGIPSPLIFALDF